MAIVLDGTTGVTFPAGGLGNTAGAAVGTTDTQTLTNKTIQGGALTLATAVASTSGTSVDFTSIPSWVKRITVMFSGVSTNGSSSLIVQIGSGSVLSSGYASSAVTAIAGGTTVGGQATNGFNTAGGGPTSIRGGIMNLALLGSNSWASSHAISYTDGTAASTGGGSATLSGVLDRIRITTVNGTDTFDAGTINIMYEG
jgi:hypothetical protein